MTTRVFMLVYAAHPSVRPITEASIAQLLSTLPDDARLTVAFNGGNAFPLPAHDKMDVVMHWPERVSLAKAYNQLANAVTARFLAFVHNDCFVSQNWLPALTAAAWDNGFAFPNVVGDEPTEALRGLGPADPNVPPSCCFVVCEEAWRDIGGFDEDYEGCHFEDLDLWTRAERKGYRLRLVDSITVFHRRGTTRVLTSDESNESFVRNLGIYLKKWGVDGKAPIPQLQKGEDHGRRSILKSSTG
jgi:hypothetical protein